MKERVGGLYHENMPLEPSEALLGSSAVCVHMVPASGNVGSSLKLRTTGSGESRTDYSDVGNDVGACDITHTSCPKSSKLVSCYLKILDSILIQH